MPNNSSSSQSRPHQVLDPRLLGRPVHLLPRFAIGFADNLSALLASPVARRYWAGFQLESATFLRRAPGDLPARWLGLESGEGALAVAFERSLLVALLESRYGSKSVPAALRPLVDERVSATEERLAAVLARQLGDTLAARMGIKLDGAPPHGTLAPAANAWVLELVLREPYTSASSAAAPPDQPPASARCWIAPDQALVNLILQTLTPKRPTVRRARGEPLVNAVKVKIEGRLLAKEITLEALFSLKVGDVIPVSVDRADVVLEEARLFTAAVAEHKGKLCLTSFEDAE